MEIKPHDNNPKIVFAYVLIGLGIFWLLRKIGLYFDIPHFYLHNIFFPFRDIFHDLTHFIFSWQMILIIVGLILMAGKRPAGVVLIVIGGIFLLPRIFMVMGVTFSMFFPVLLVGLGIAMIARKI